MRCLPGSLYLLTEYKKTPFVQEPVETFYLCLPMEEVLYGQPFYAYIIRVPQLRLVREMQKDFIQHTEEEWLLSRLQQFEEAVEVGYGATMPLGVQQVGLTNTYELVHLCDLFEQWAHRRDKIQKRLYLEKLAHEKARKKKVPQPTLPEVKEEEEWLF